MATSMNPEERLNRFSTFGEVLSQESWTTRLLDDFVMSDVYNLGGGQVPRLTKVDELIKWAEIRSLLEETGKVHAYGKIRGWPPYLEAYARRYNEWYRKETGGNLELDPKKHIIVVPSLSAGNLFLVQSFCGLDEKSGVKYKCVGLIPNYVGIERQFPSGPEKTFIAIYQKMKINENNGTFKFEPDQDTLETLENALNIPEVNAYYGPRPNNPDGSIISQEVLEKMVKLAEKKGVKFIQDCAYAGPDPNYVYDDVKCVPVFSDNSIIEHTHSKYGEAGDRLGEWVSKNEKLMKRLERVVANTIFHTQQSSQAYTQRLMEQQVLFTTLMEKDALTEIDKTYREFLKRNIRTILDTFRKECVSYKENKVLVCKPQGAFYVFCHVDLPEGITSQTLYRDLKNKKRTIIVPGDAFVFGKPYNPNPEVLGYDPLTLGAKTFRLSAVERTEERMRQGVLNVCEQIDHYNGIHR